MRKLMLLAAMLAMVLVAAAPAMAQNTISQYSDDDETTINTICNQVLGIAAEQTQYGDANAAAVDESEAAAAAANELGIDVDQALACFDSNAAAGDDNVVGDVEDVVGVVGVDDDADGAVDEDDGSEAAASASAAASAGAATLPDTGGASLFTLGAGALLVAGGLLARRIFR